MTLIRALFPFAFPAQPCRVCRRLVLCEEALPCWEVKNEGWKCSECAR